MSEKQARYAIWPKQGTHRALFQRQLTTLFVRGVGAVLLLGSVALLAVATFVYGRWLTDPLAFLFFWGDLDAKTKVKHLLILLQLATIFPGSVGLLLLRRWGADLTVTAMVVTITYGLLDLGTASAARLVSTLAIPLALLGFVMCVRLGLVGPTLARKRRAKESQRSQQNVGVVWKVVANILVISGVVSIVALLCDMVFGAWWQLAHAAMGRHASGAVIRAVMADACALVGAGFVMAGGISLKRARIVRAVCACGFGMVLVAIAMLFGLNGDTLFFFGG